MCLLRPVLWACVEAGPQAMRQAVSAAGGTAEAGLRKCVRLLLRQVRGA